MTFLQAAAMAYKIGLPVSLKRVAGQWIVTPRQ